MNFREMETDQKLRGGYYTQPDIAVFLSRWVLERRPGRLLEPSCGDGAFIQAVTDLRPAHPIEIVGCEIEPSEARKCMGRVQDGAGIAVLVHVSDFLDWWLGRAGSPPEFDGVLGNPPFIRYQYLEPQQQARAERVFARLNLPFTRHTNAWAPFVVASLDRLRPGGRMAMVVPAEILHVLHAKSVRDFLLRECSRVLI